MTLSSSKLLMCCIYLHYAKCVKKKLILMFFCMCKNFHSEPLQLWAAKELILKNVFASLATWSLFWKKRIGFLGGALGNIFPGLTLYVQKS